jgi:hypothetical protein
MPRPGVPSHAFTVVPTAMALAGVTDQIVYLEEGDVVDLQLGEWCAAVRAKRAWVPTHRVHPFTAKVRAAFQLAINGAVTIEMLKAYFEIPNIVVAGQVIATSAEGQAITADDIWSDDVLFAHVQPGQDLMRPNLARTFNWSGVGTVEGQVATWYDDDRKSTMHSVDHSTDEKIVGADAGYLLTDAIK